MKRIRTNRGWFQGLLIGLVVLGLTGNAFAALSYVDIIDFKADGYINGMNSEKVEKNVNTYLNIGSTNPIDVGFILDGSIIDNKIKPLTSGTWESVKAVNYIAIHAGGGHSISLFEVEEEDGLFSGIWSTPTYVDEKGKTKNHDLSNLYLFEKASAVPVPAAIWLLGSGIVGLVMVKKRKDQI
ncbi:MAG: VPLPA-CTERM sorting domain-containing protein [Desulfobacula sp.]|uniref:VPLPA-CTERM sorting domain-containing protein n=1 Tax=Desulfobacula sp. TaxID=2593537 RepID=UPI001D8CF098|nr:VPLPA-CTERM sorting domain-containing protein [Desulfobacula sp.]MBT3487184.1 VPLPA-CTERM sorting domain-containing protein [Desulfobacula sp.]MBT3806081.1 VPLPA-CTERM sorting domain-containing protein [Desulfobacula sp.]MBT4026746.1 VPLPA-CTERM sorting domain-containing protein [Desulfobacula sp.]MBT4199439.1 VPLPA-CTERM sorting domain-containing protein [Desulfobacula sp.]